VRGAVLAASPRRPGASSSREPELPGRERRLTRKGRIQ
jgi:hypothetical protein